MGKKDYIILALLFVCFCGMIVFHIVTVNNLNNENWELTVKCSDYEREAFDWQTKAENLEIKLVSALGDLENCSNRMEELETIIYEQEQTISGLESEIKALEQIVESFNENDDWDYEYTETEVKELAAVMFGEEEGDSFMSAGAGSVVLNRVSRSDFPNTVHDVIYEIIKTKDATYEQYAPRTKRILESVVVGKPISSTLADVEYLPQWYFDLARFLLENGSIFPKNVVYQAHFKQGKGVYYEKNGEFFCYG